MCKSDVGIKYRILQVAHGEVLSVMEVRCVIYCGLWTDDIHGELFFVQNWRT
jgi:hypothetical protein